MSDTLPALGARTRLPGGGHLEETWNTPLEVTIALVGEIDSYDEHAVVDALTGCILAGARRLQIRADRADFVGLSLLHAFQRVRRHLSVVGGDVEVTGLGSRLDPVWTHLATDRPMVGVVGAPPSATRDRGRVLVGS